MFEEYLARCADGRFRLGDVFEWNEGDEVIYRLGIQEQSTKKAKVPALTTSLKAMVELASWPGSIAWVYRASVRGRPGSIGRG